jgi:hypothetical protein
MSVLHRLFERRTFLRAGLGALAGALGLARIAGADETPAGSHARRAAADRRRGGAPAGFVPVVAPDVQTLPFERDDAVKVFRLVAEPVKQEVLPGRVFDLWGYNGSAPGPTIEVFEGDRVRVLFENRLPEATTVHWHGLEVPIEMDGVPVISQPEVGPGGRFTYEFTLHQHGTFFYHSHGAMQEMMGMLGLFIVHPRTPYTPPVQKDFALVLQEYAVLPSNSIPNSLSMEFNWLTFNGKAAPATTPMLVRLGERVRIRLVNIGMDHHPIHLHGNQFAVTGTEGGRIPQQLWYPENTVLVGVAQARTIEFDAKYPGDWMLHCHLPHHMMDQMVSMVGPSGGQRAALAGAGPRLRRVHGRYRTAGLHVDPQPGGGDPALHRAHAHALVPVLRVPLPDRHHAAGLPVVQPPVPGPPLRGDRTRDHAEGARARPTLARCGAPPGLRDGRAHARYPAVPQGARPMTPDPRLGAPAPTRSLSR